MTSHPAMTKKTSWEIGDPETSYSLPSSFFFDPKVLEAERDAIFYKGWHVVGHVNELSEPGAFLTQDIFDQSVIVTRGRDGEVRAFHNVCQHRGNRLLQERRGTLNTVIRCGYHSWCYGLEGELRSAPRSERVKNFDRSAFGLKPVRIERFAGFYYVNLDPAAAPLSTITEGAEAEMRRFFPDLDGLRFLSEVDVEVPANWKVIMENSIEGYHFDLSGPVHKQIGKMIDLSQWEPRDHGKWWTYKAPPKPGVNSAYGESLEGATYQTDWFFNIGIWPNTTFYCFPFSDMLGTFVMIPLEPEKSLLRFGYYAPDRPLPKVTEASFRWMNEELGPEDIQLNVTNQKGLRSFGFDQGRYMIDAERSNESEHLVHHFHKLVYEAIRP
jgi:phenylpropionate dioxygenase-like ring-hydroxylating dioxygenase large terminal subunit